MDVVTKFIHDYQSEFGVAVSVSSAAHLIFRYPRTYRTITGLCQLKLRLARHIAAELGVPSATFNRFERTLDVKRHPLFYDVTIGNGGKYHFKKSKAFAWDKQQQQEIIKKYRESIAVLTEQIAEAPVQLAEIQTMFNGERWETFLAVAAWQREKYPHLACKSC